MEMFHSNMSNGETKIEFFSASSFAEDFSTKAKLIESFLNVYALKIRILCLNKTVWLSKKTADNPQQWKDGLDTNSCAKTFLNPKHSFIDSQNY